YWMAVFGEGPWRMSHGPSLCVRVCKGSLTVKVTALRVQQRKRGRINVFLDDEYAFSLQDILAATLHVGQDLDEQQVASLLQRDAEERAYEMALNYLTYRPRSEWEIRRYLTRKTVAEEGADKVIGRLQRAGLLNDGEFARFWVESRENSRPRGVWGLRSELRGKGVSDEVIERATRDVDEAAGALDAARRYVRRLERLDGEVFRRRLFAFLQRQGFGYQVCKDTTNRMWQEIAAQRQEDSE
ncbi:MAG: regulatory protein RecX, partial [Anaerolineae bacterium]